jgi:hypothetical protein
MELIEEIKFMEYYIENVIMDLESSIDNIKDKFRNEVPENKPSQLDWDLCELQIKEEIEKLLNKGEFELFLSISKKYYNSEIEYYWEDILNGDLESLITWNFGNCILYNMKEILEKPEMIKYAGFDPNNNPLQNRKYIK